MTDRVVLRAIAWQIYGGLLATLGIAAIFAELGWWIFFLYDRSLVSPPWSWGIHSAAFVALVAGCHYAVKRRDRERSLRSAGDRAVLEGKGPQFTIGPFPVKVEIAFFIMAALFGFMTGGLIRAAVFVVSATFAVLAHELGHAAVARRAGHTASIHLHLLGGTTVHYGPPLSRAATIATAFAGPAVGLAIGALAFPALRITHSASGTVDGIVTDFVFVNAGWAAINLAPILPLDGGWILREMVSSAPARLVSFVCAAGAATALWMRDQVPLAIFFLMLAVYNLEETALYRHVAALVDALNRR